VSGHGEKEKCRGQAHAEEEDFFHGVDARDKQPRIDRFAEKVFI